MVARLPSNLGVAIPNNIDGRMQRMQTEFNGITGLRWELLVRGFGRYTRKSTRNGRIVYYSHLLAGMPEEATQRISQCMEEAQGEYPVTIF